MSTPQHAQSKAAIAYNAASDYYDHPSNSFWDRFGRGTVERLSFGAGAHVLDVCCGAGASVIPSVEKAGPTGSVLGVDLAEHLLEIARAKAKSRGLSSVEFRVADMLDLPFPDASFDVVLCIFGIFFVPDMPIAVRELWRLVRPGGQLAITTWGPRMFEAANTAFWESIREVRPDLYKGFNPWDRITDPQSLISMMSEGGVPTVEAVAVRGTHKLSSPEDWWLVILGSGYRGTIEQLSPSDREQVYEVNMSYIRREAVTEIETNVVYSVAHKDQPLLD